MIVWVSVRKEREMSVFRWELEALESERAVVASLGYLLQLLCLVFEVLKERRLRKVTSIEELISRNKGLKIVSATISQGNEPFGCWGSSKKEANSTSWVNRTPCFEQVQEGVERSRLVRGQGESQQTDCVRHMQKSEEKRVFVWGYQHWIPVGIRKCDSRDRLLN